PRRPRPRVEAAVEAACHDDAVLEGSAELRRECEAVLVVKGVLVLAQQHGPLRTTLPPFSPHVNPAGAKPPPPACAPRSHARRPPRPSSKRSRRSSASAARLRTGPSHATATPSRST